GSFALYKDVETRLSEFAKSSGCAELRTALRSWTSRVRDALKVQAKPNSNTACQRNCSLWNSWKCPTVGIFGARVPGHAPFVPEFPRFAPHYTTVPPMTFARSGWRIRTRGNAPPPPATQFPVSQRGPQKWAAHTRRLDRGHYRERYRPHHDRTASSRGAIGP